MAPRAALLTVMAIVSLAASPKASAQSCWYGWYGGKSTAVVAPGQPADFAGAVYGIAQPYYVRETYAQGGNFTLYPFNVSYQSTVAPSQYMVLPPSPSQVLIHGVVPTSATSGQTAHVTLALYDGNTGAYVCGTTVTIQVVNAPALSTEMNTIGGNNEADEYYKGIDLHLYKLTYTGVWNHDDITVRSGYAPPLDVLSPIASQTDAFYNKSEVFYLDATQHIEAVLYDNSHHTWSYKDITTAAGAAPGKAGSPLVSLVDPYAQFIEVHYLDASGHIHQLFSSDRVTWHTSDLTAAIAGALPAASNSPLIGQIDSMNNSAEIYYIGTDGHVRELWWSWFGSGSGDASGAAGAPNPASGSALVCLANTVANSVNVDYLTPDHHIHELWWAPSAGWHSDDLTTAAGGSNAAAGSSLATEINTLAGKVELYYFDSNWKVSELQFDPGTWHWYSTDPTYLTDAVNAAAGSALVSLVKTVDNTVEVHYLTPDNHIRELWWDGVWYADDFTSIVGNSPAVPYFCSDDRT